MPEYPKPAWDFHGGLHIDDHKSESLATPLREAGIPTSLTLPLQQHIGQAAEPVVQVGDEVLKGQLIARASDYVSANLHAPTSGRVVEIAERPIAVVAHRGRQQRTVAKGLADEFTAVHEKERLLASAA